MNLVSINDWLQIAANFGLFLGLVLVFLQLRQNAHIARTQIVNEYYLADMQLELSMMGNDPAKAWVKGIYSPDQLTPEEAAVVDRYFNYGLVQLERIGKLRDLGVATKEDFDDRVEYLQWHLGNATGKRWWAFSRRFHRQEFADLVDRTLSGPKHTPDNKSLLDAVVSPGGGDDFQGDAGPGSAPPH